MPAIFLAGIDAVGVALVALVALTGIWAVTYILSQWGQHVPFIGDWLRDVASSWLAAEAQSASWFYVRLLWALKSVIFAAQSVLAYIPNRIFATSTSLLSLAGWIRWRLIPDTLRAANYYAGILSDWSNRYAYGLYVDAVDYAVSLWRSATGYAASLYGAALDYVDRLIIAVEVDIESAYLAARSYTDAMISRLILATNVALARLSADIAAVRDFATGLVGDAVRTIESDIAAVEARITDLMRRYVAAAESDMIKAVDVAAAATLAQVWPGIVTDVDELIRTIPQELIDIRDQVARIPRVVPRDLADAMAALGVLAIPMLRYLRDCGVPMCRDLHGLADMLGDLNSLATDAAMLGLFTLAAADPHAAADAILAVVGPVADASATITRDLVGV